MLGHRRLIMSALKASYSASADLAEVHFNYHSIYRMTRLFLLAFAAQACYWLGLRRGFQREGRAARQRVDEKPASPPISVVVAARNEEQTLPRLLQSLEAQDHPDYEVVVVDDGSVDRTPEILRSWRDKVDGLRVLRTTGIGKKGALTKGITASRYDLLAFTDADCIPPAGWLSSIARAHAATHGDNVLIGYSPFRKDAGLVSRIARYETFVTGFLTAGAAGLGRPYMAVGRNISYPRAVFDRVGGFESIMHSMSGDDDLFVQVVARRRAADIRALLDPASFVPTDGPRDFREWLRQKRRHTSAGRFYRPSIKAHHAVFHGSSLLLWMAPLLAGWPGAGLLASRLLLQHLLLREPAQALQERDLVSIQPFLEPLYLLYIALVAPMGLLRLPRRW